MVPSYSQDVREAFPAAPAACLCCLLAGLVEMHQGTDGQWSTARWWPQLRHLDEVLEAGTNEFWPVVQSVNKEDLQLTPFVLQRNCNPGLSYFALLQT